MRTGIAVDRSTVERLPAAILTVGAVLVALHAWGVIASVIAHGRPFEGPDHLVALVTALPFSLLTIATGAWLLRSDLERARYPRIAGWWTTGIVAFVAIAALILLPDPPTGGEDIVGVAVWTVSIGSGIGVTIGLSEGRAIHRAVTAERQAVRTAQLERQRDLLDYLNSVLRHEVLNTATVIDGYAATLLEAEGLDEATRRRVHTIRRQATDMTRVIDDVRVLLRRTEDDADLERVELRAVLREEVRKLQDRYEGVSVELTAPDELVVAADSMLPRAIGNLLSNAVEHNDADEPRVEVAASAVDGEAVVRISDDGPGIPAAEAGDLFERAEGSGSSHGLGLYIVAQLAERYGGAIDLVETGPEGSTFVLTLPLAEEPSDPPAASVVMTG